MKKVYIIVGSVLVALGLIWVGTLLASPSTGAGADGQDYNNSVWDNADNQKKTVSYTCDGNKSILAVYENFARSPEDNRVFLELSDKRYMTLMQVISGSGARYADGGDNFVFWNKGNTAFVEEGGKMTYSNCAQK